MEAGVRVRLVLSNKFSKKLLRNFGFLIGFAFPILIGWILPSLGGHPFRYWTLWISIPSLFLAVSRPSLLFYPYVVWMKLGHMLGWLNGRLILGLIFLLILQPISLIMKILGHDPLRIKKSKNKSYREIKINHEVNLKKIF